MSPVIEFGPMDEAAQKLGKEWSDLIQAAIKKGPNRFKDAINEGIEAVMETSSFASLMKNESDDTDEATFDTKKVAAQIGLGIMMDNAKDFMSLDA